MRIQAPPVPRKELIPQRLPNDDGMVKHMVKHERIGSNPILNKNSGSYQLLVLELSYRKVPGSQNGSSIV